MSVNRCTETCGKIFEKHSGILCGKHVKVYPTLEVTSKLWCYLGGRSMLGVLKPRICMLAIQKRLAYSIALCECVIAFHFNQPFGARSECWLRYELCLLVPLCLAKSPSLTTSAVHSHACGLSGMHPACLKSSAICADSYNQHNMVYGVYFIQGTT